MPTTTVGLVLFIVVLAPGLTYQRFRAASTPDVKLSALTEVGTVALQSVLWDVAALALFGAARTIVPDHTPDVGALTRSGSTYLTRHGAYIFWWAVGVLAVACALAAAAASVASSPTGTKLRRSKLLSLMTPHGSVTPQSAWWVLFHAQPETIKHVAVTLDDSYWLSGTLHSYSPNSDETADRELTLAGPVKYRNTTGQEGDDLGVSAVAVSARSIRLLTVSYVPKQPPAT